MTISQTQIGAVTHYLQKGLARGPAIGIVSCLSYESNLNPGSQGHQSTETPGALNPSGAFGIASWNGPRQEALASFAKVKNLPVGALTTQLDFVLTESANSYPKVWAAIEGGAPYSEFIPIFVADYENPADHQKEINAAMAIAGPLDAAVPQFVVLAPAPAPAPVVPTPTPAPVPTPIPMPAPPPAPAPVTGVPTLDPILAALLTQIVEALASGVVKAVLAQLSTGSLPSAITAPPSPAAPAPAAAPAFDLGSLVGPLGLSLTSALTSSLPGLIAMEMTKMIPAPKA